MSTSSSKQVRFNKSSKSGDQRGGVQSNLVSTMSRTCKLLWILLYLLCLIRSNGRMPTSVLRVAGRTEATALELRLPASSTVRSALHLIDLYIIDI